jgi:hypothetical protein
MLDFGAGAYPVTADYNGDGLMDIFTGNFGYYDSSYYDQFLILYSDHTSSIGLLENIGTAGQPEFRLENKDFAETSSLGKLNLVPAFGDLDGDGDTDMLLGSKDGGLVFYENTAGPGAPMEMTLRTENYQQIVAGDYTAPALGDVNRDGLLDLLIGKKDGRISYYRNAGSQSEPDFTLVTDFLGEINVTNPDVSLDGYSVPRIFDDQGENSLLVGSEDGKIFYFRHFYEHLSGVFPESDSLFNNLEVQPVDPDRGYRTAATAIDLDQDGNLEVIAGNFSGGLEYFGKTGKPQVNLSVDENSYTDKRFELYPNPASGYINIIPETNNSPINLLVSDLLGHVLVSATIPSSGPYRLDVSGWKKGIYLVTLGDEETFEVRKVIVL